MAAICIVGNSHLGALAQASKGNALFLENGDDLVYWGSAGSLFPQTRYEDGRLISPNPQRSLRISSGRYDHLKIDDFDKIVFYACHIVFYNEARALAIALQKDAPRSSRFIDHLIADYIENWWRDHHSRRLIETVCTHHPDKSYIVAPHPLVATSDKYLGSLRDVSQFKVILDAFNRHLDAWCVRIGAAYYYQNQITLDDMKVSTKTVYSKGSIKMEAEQAHPEEDVVHMNATFGEIVLADLSALLRTMRIPG